MREKVIWKNPKDFSAFSHQSVEVLLLLSDATSENIWKNFLDIIDDPFLEKLIEIAELVFWD